MLLFLKRFIFCILLVSVLFVHSYAWAKPVVISFREKVIGGGHMDVTASINNRDFKLNDTIEIDVDIDIVSKQAQEVIKKLDGLYLLIRAERAFDKNGKYHQFSNNYASTVLTPSGLPIENHDIFCEYFDKNPIEYVDDLKPSNRALGHSNATPFDRNTFIPKSKLTFSKKGIHARFTINDTIADDFLDGYYRFQVSVLAKRGRNFYRVNFLPLFSKKESSYSDWDMAILARNSSYLPVIKIGDPAEPKMIWTLFAKQYSNGTQGIVSREDSDNFQFNSRHVVPSTFILPAKSQHQSAQTLTIEPDFPTMFAKKVVKLEQGEKWEFQTPIPLDYNSGKLFVSITAPDQSIREIGPAPFKVGSDTGATTESAEFNYTFDQSGKYTIVMKGWIKDIWGNRYNGGGTYDVWVGHRLTFATSVKPGTPFEVGSGYPPSIMIHPPCPADVTVDVKLFRNSNVNDVKHVVTQGKANRFGYFYPRGKFEKMQFDSPGEYLATITASYVDEHGEFWMGSQRSGSVVAEADSKLIVHGASPFTHNMGYINKRGDTRYEGVIAKSNNPNCQDYTVCTLFPFPYYSGDVLYMANSFKGDNGLLPVLQASYPEEIIPGITKSIFPFSTTSNRYQPQGYPEFLEKQCYGYMSAIRAGFVARYMVSEDTSPIWDSYWQSGANFAGNQINNSYNGDLPNDIYQFLGGFVLRDYKTGNNKYGIYSSMGIIIPKGSYANRVTAPLSEPLLNINGRDHYIMDVGAPLAGMVFETSDILRAGAMILPPIPGVSCLRKVTCPSGKQYIFKGTSNKIGLAKLVAAEGADIPITEPGVYEVESACSFEGKKGDIIGSGDGKYFIYAVDQNNYKQHFELDLPERFLIDNKNILYINGKIDAAIKDPKIYYTIVMPGMIMDEGVLETKDHSFLYKFSPSNFAVQFPNYDIVGRRDPNEQMMADTAIFTFFMTGTNAQNQPAHSVKRFILRGNKGLVLN